MDITVIDKAHYCKLQTFYCTELITLEKKVDTSRWANPSKRSQEVLRCVRYMVSEGKGQQQIMTFGSTFMVLYLIKIFLFVTYSIAK